MRIILPVAISAFLFCQSQSTRVPDKTQKNILEHIYLSDSEMQFTLEYANAEVLSPVHLARAANCAVIAESARARFLEMYPAAGKFAFEMKLMHTVYVGSGGCRQLYKITAPDLRKKLGG